MSINSITWNTTFNNSTPPFSSPPDEPKGLQAHKNVDPADWRGNALAFELGD